MLMDYYNVKMKDYEYDETGKLTRVTYEDGSYEEYVYDSNGNIVSVNYVKKEDGCTEENINTDINQEDVINTEDIVNHDDTVNQEGTINTEDIVNTEETNTLKKENKDDTYSADVTVKKDIGKEKLSNIHIPFVIIAVVFAGLVLTTLITRTFYRKKRNLDTRRGENTYEKKNTEDKE